MSESPAAQPNVETNVSSSEPENLVPSAQPVSSTPSSYFATLNPSLNQSSAVPAMAQLQPHQVNPYAVPVQPAPQFSHHPMLNYPGPGVPNPGVQPPGVTSMPIGIPGSAVSIGSINMSVPGMMQHYAPPGQPSNPALRPYGAIPNGYHTFPPSIAQGAIPPPAY